MSVPVPNRLARLNGEILAKHLESFLARDPAIGRTPAPAPVDDAAAAAPVDVSDLLRIADPAEFVRAAFQRTLGRDPQSGELEEHADFVRRHSPAYELTLLVQHAAADAGVSADARFRGFWRPFPAVSLAALSGTDLVIAAFRSILWRDPGTEEFIRYLWVAERSGAERLLTALASSPEAARYPRLAGLPVEISDLARSAENPEAFVRLAYQRILGREPDPAGLRSTAAALRWLPRRRVLRNLAESDEAKARGVAFLWGGRPLGDPPVWAAAFRPARARRWIAGYAASLMEPVALAMYRRILPLEGSLAAARERFETALAEGQRAAEEARREAERRHEAAMSALSQAAAAQAARMDAQAARLDGLAAAVAVQKERAAAQASQFEALAGSVATLAETAAAQGRCLAGMAVSTAAQSAQAGALAENAAAQTQRMDELVGQVRALTTHTAAHTDRLDTLAANAAAETQRLDELVGHARALTTHTAAHTERLDTLAANAAAETQRMDELVVHARTLTTHTAAHTDRLDTLAANAATETQRTDELVSHARAHTAHTTAQTQRLDAALAAAVELLARQAQTDRSVRDLGNRIPPTAVPAGDRLVVSRVHGYVLAMPAEDALLTSMLTMYGSVDAGLVAFFSRALKPGMTFVDVGANIGIHTVNAAFKVGEFGRVIGFEPAPRAFDILKMNLVLNSVAGRVAVHRIAITDRPGTARFIMETISGHSSLYAPREAGSEMEVPTASLDDALAGVSSIDWVKIDAEGAEAAIFRGMRSLIERHRGMRIVVELAPSLLERAGESPAVFLSDVALAGFRIRRINDLTGEPEEAVPEALLGIESSNLLLERGQ